MKAEKPDPMKTNSNLMSELIGISSNLPRRVDKEPAKNAKRPSGEAFGGGDEQDSDQFKIKKRKYCKYCSTIQSARNERLNANALAGSRRK